MGSRAESPEREGRNLLRRISRGDGRAFTVVYERYAPAALGLATKICGDRVLAEDVVQEAFLSLWRKSDSYRAGRGSVSAYILGVVHHKAVDAVRHEESLKRRERAGGENLVESVPDDLVEEAWISIIRDQIREAVSRLTLVQKEALDLAYFEGLTYSEVATKLGIPLGTAKTRLRDGMMRMRELLADSGLGEAE